MFVSLYHSLSLSLSLTDTHTHTFPPLCFSPLSLSLFLTFTKDHRTPTPTLSPSLSPCLWSTLFSFLLSFFFNLQSFWNDVLNIALQPCSAILFKVLTVLAHQVSCYFFFCGSCFFLCFSQPFIQLCSQTKLALSPTDSARLYLCELCSCYVVLINSLQYFYSDSAFYWI